MITLEEAQERILDALRPLPAERVSLDRAGGRVLAEALEARRDLPPADNSAVDGYAVRFEDLSGGPIRLALGETVPAGGAAGRAVGAGEAFRIFTGAPMPPGADTAVMQEDTRPFTGGVEIVTAPRLGANVRRRGDDVRAGEVVIPAGTRVGPVEVANAAAHGRSWLMVHRRPRVALFSSGDELVPPDADVTGGRIVDTNGPSLGEAVREAGGEPVQLGSAPDDPAAIGALVDAAAGAADVLVGSGGVSVGDYDYVKGVLESRGLTGAFWKVAIKPGKPLLYGRLAGRPVFGLPGNPMSALVTFEVFVRPVLRRLAGHAEVFRPVVRVRLAGPAPAARGRLNFIFATLEPDGGGWLARPTGSQASHRLSRAVGAHALIPVPADRPLEAGAEVGAWWIRPPGA